MAEAQFMPGAPVGYVADQAYRGVEEQQSMMQRASQLRQSQQMEQLRQQQISQNNILMPVKVATAQADLATAAASLATNTRMQVARKQSAEAAPIANDEFTEALKLADWDSQASELGRLQAKYAFMGQFPEYKGFLSAIDEARGNAIMRAKTDQLLEAEQTRAETLAGARTTVAEIGAGARKEVAEVGGEARVKAAEVATEGRKEIATAGHDASMDRTEVRGLNAAAIQADREALKFAENGDDAKAAEARRTAESFRAQAKEKATKPTPDTFNVPNVTNKGQTPSTGATSDGQPRLYIPPADGQPPAFTPAVKTPDDVLSAMQQMVNDGVITVDQARETLTKLGFKKKGG